MPNSFQTDVSGLFARQAVGAYLDYAIDWSDWLQTGDSIATSMWAADPALTVNTTAVAGALATCWIQGGAAGTWYAVSNTVTSQAGRVDTRTFRLYVYDSSAAGAAAQDQSTLFTNRTQAIASLRNDRLVLASQSVLPGISISDDYIWEKLRAAEMSISRDLRVPLVPTQFFPIEPTPAQIAALPVGMPWDIDPAYDYDPDFFQGERWGFIVARNYPIIAISSLQFAYPAPTNSVFDVPLDWLRTDNKYGHIRLVPATKAFSAPLSAFVMQALGGGKTIPFMIQMTYQAGLTDAINKWPDLIDVIKKRAVLKIIEDAFIPQSGSISADGLSQSISVDLSKYEDSVDRKLYGPPGSNGGLMTAIHGVRGTVMGY